MNEQPTIHKIGAIIFDDQQRVLAVHKKGKPECELIVPGGIQEAGETDEQTLRREIWEELSAHINAFHFYDQFEAQAIYESKWLIMRVYVVTLDRMPAASQEIDQLVWLDSNYLDSGYQFASILGQQLLPRLFKSGEACD
jgi:8-oxo-dGTP diphosphatase